ncbi:Arylsulfatase [Pontiella desulfatans]|uniref:Arylsulfatase n=1 Tax=Pontiella desulfatans TaxID=2750659 RepID=A0A6C2U7A5_PONDE|nr:sulfatase [Pontiella desulfatans]SPS74000.1 sulfatase S1_14 [Kiritimatiellales bacterium]VGO15739.1 Arylsulfatase [Pontiella desulfatans]
MKHGIKSHVAIAIAAASICTAVVAKAERPNIVIIFNDDQGYQDLGCYGSPDIKTPRVDQMAAEGMKFTDFLVASSVCSPSRAALLTGCYPNRVGVPSVYFPDRGKGGLEPEHVTIAEMLKTVGYNTAAVGKWHLGDELKYLPTNQGFDSYYGIPYSNDMYPASTMKYADDCLFLEGQSHETLKEAYAGKLRNGNPISLKNKVPLMRGEECIEFPADQTTITRRFTDEGIVFISESVKEEKPFFLYLAHSMPHIPLFVAPEFEGKSERGLYGDVIEEIDFNTGRILDHLKTLGIEDNTLVVFTSDNGPWLIMKENGGSAGPLFEGKMTTFEGGQRVPCIMKWPGHIPAGTVCDELASTIDLMPTFAAITGAALPTVQPLDGKNILDLLTSQPGAKSPHEFFFYGQAAVRQGDWKYHAREHFKVKETAREHKGPTLYNLKDDIGESNNVIDEHPEIAARLAKVLESNPNKRVDDGKAVSTKDKNKKKKGKKK